METKENTNKKSSNRTVYWICFGIFFIIFATFAPPMLGKLLPTLSQHMEILYIYLGICVVILLYLKIKVLKNHNWDTFLSLILVALIIANVCYGFFKVDKYFPEDFKKLGYYSWWAVFLIPTIVFFCIDTTNYYKVVEFEQRIEDHQSKVADRRHRRFMKKREKNPPFWMKNKTNKIICDTIVYVVYFLIFIGIIAYLYYSYIDFQERLRIEDERNSSI